VSLPNAKPLLRQLQWLPVRQRISYKFAVLTFKIHITSTPSYLSRHITARDCRCTLRSSTVSLLSVPFHRTNFSRRAFRCTAPITWNSLPHSVITATHCQLLSLGSRLTCLGRLSVLHVFSCTAVPVLSATQRL